MYVLFFTRQIISSPSCIINVGHYILLDQSNSSTEKDAEPSTVNSNFNQGYYISLLLSTGTNYIFNYDIFI